MIRGLYASATGMLALMDKQEVIVNNLANVDTTGFRQDYAAVTSFPEALVYASRGQSSASKLQAPIGWLNTGAGIGERGFISKDGILRETGGNLDLALSGDGFFTIQMPTGEVYTRNGSFMRDGSGRLTDQDGRLVLGEKGSITITGNTISIDESGDLYADGAYMDTLKIRRFSKGDLTKVADNFFAASSKGKPATGITIRQGYLEGSNVDVPREMVDMVATARSFEANQRILKSQDEILSRAVNDVGRLA